MRTTTLALTLAMGALAEEAVTVTTGEVSTTKPAAVKPAAVRYVNPGGMLYGRPVLYNNRNRYFGASPVRIVGNVGLPQAQLTEEQKKAQEKADDVKAWEESYWEAVGKDDEADSKNLLTKWKDQTGANILANTNVLYEVNKYKTFSSQNAYMKNSRLAYQQAMAKGGTREELSSAKRTYMEDQTAYLKKINDIGFMGTSGTSRTNSINIMASGAEHASAAGDFAKASRDYRLGKGSHADYRNAQKTNSIKTAAYLNELQSAGFNLNLPTSYFNHYKWEDATHDLEEAEASYDAGAAAYNKDKSAANFYALEILELKLQVKETSYQIAMANRVPNMATLLGGNWVTLLKWQNAMRKAKIAKLAEKLQAEKFKAKYGSYPSNRAQTRFGRGSFNDQNKILYTSILGM